MMKFAILCVSVALLTFQSAEARGRRSCSSCNQGPVQQTFQGSTVCSGSSCQVVRTAQTTPAQTIPTQTIPQTAQNPEPILVRGSDGRLYYLVPEAQYRK